MTESANVLPARGSKTTFWVKAEVILVVLVALHTLIVGVMLTFFASWALQFGGWSQVPPLFFPRQGGAFHLVVGFGYLYEYFRHRGVSLMLCAKLVATVFLGVSCLTDSLPWSLAVSAVGDAAMGLAVLYVHRKAVLSRASLAD